MRRARPPYAPHETMRHRSPARWLAPLALVVCVLAVAAVLGEALSPEERSGAASSSTVSDSTKTVSERRISSKRKTYRVRSGDTLTAISVRTGVPLERLRQLNPEVDSDALQTGERIRLRR
jgi:LysM repeat protein